MAALDALDDWPVATAAAAVVGPSGVLAAHGDTDRPFVLASVTKLLVARAVQVAIEEGVVELDTPAGLPDSTVRHLLAHASGLAMHSDHILAAGHPPDVLQPRIHRAGRDGRAGLRLRVHQYLSEAIFEPLGMAATRLDGGAEAAGFGAISTVADLAAFAADLLCPTTVSAPMHADAISVQFPGLDGVLPGYGVQRPNDWGWVSRSRGPSRRTGRGRKLVAHLRPFRAVGHVYLG